MRQLFINELIEHWKLDIGGIKATITSCLLKQRLFDMLVKLLEDASTSENLSRDSTGHSNENQ